MRLFRHTHKKNALEFFVHKKKSLVFGHATDFYGGGDHPNNDDASFSDDDFWWRECAATGKKTRSGACVCFGGAKNKCAFTRQKRFKEMASTFPKTTTTLCDVLDDDDDGQRNGGGKGRRRGGNHHVEEDER